MAYNVLYNKELKDGSPFLQIPLHLQNKQIKYATPYPKKSPDWRVITKQNTVISKLFKPYVLLKMLKVGNLRVFLKISAHFEADI